jgi:hypothetical protein
MTKFTRQLLTLIRKNFITWRRTPICSVVEIILLPLLLSFLIWLRTVEPVKYTDLEGLKRYRHPIYPALEYRRLGWTWDPPSTDEIQGPMLEYGNYIPRLPGHSNNGTYMISEDWKGPAFFFPS